MSRREEREIDDVEIEKNQEDNKMMNGKEENRCEVKRKRYVDDEKLRRGSIRRRQSISQSWGACAGGRVASPILRDHPWRVVSRFPSHTGWQAPLVPRHPRGLHGRTPQHT